MKIQTTAHIKALAINGIQQDLSADQLIDLEFSAIDTGGGFKDPMLDFSFTIPENNIDVINQRQRTAVTVTISDPNEGENQSSFSCESELHAVEGDRLEFNGRLKEEQLGRELIGFVFKLLR